MHNVLAILGICIYLELRNVKMIYNWYQIISVLLIYVIENIIKKYTYQILLENARLGGCKHIFQMILLSTFLLFRHPQIWSLQRWINGHHTKNKINHSLVICYMQSALLDVIPSSHINQMFAGSMTSERPPLSKPFVNV